MKKRFLLKDHPKKCQALLFIALIVFSLLSLPGRNLLPALAQGPGLTSRVSVASDGTQGHDHSSSPSPSADGRYVAFHSAATNLVSGDTNNVADIFNQRGYQWQTGHLHSPTRLGANRPGFSTRHLEIAGE